MMSPDFSELSRRHRAFLDHAPVDRPLLGIWVGDYYFTTNYPHGVSRWQPGESILPDRVTFEQFIPDYLALADLHERLGDDFFYVGSAYPGVPWMEAIMGCPVYAEHTSAWTAPILETYAQLDALRTPLDASPWFRQLMAITAALVEWADGRFPVNPPLLRGPADTAAALRGAERFVLDFADQPEQVQQLLALCTERRRQVVAAIRQITQPFHGGWAAGGYPSRLWAPGATVLYNQEDAAAILSPRIFRQVLQPLEAAIASDADVAFMHLHSGCLYPARILLDDASYAVIQVNYDHAGTSPRLEAILPVLRDVIARKPLLLWGEFTMDEMGLLLDELGPSGLSLQPVVSTESQAMAFKEEFYSLCSRR